MAELLGTRALAREIGVTPAAVTKAVKEGRVTPTKVTRSGPLFDLASVQAEWQPALRSAKDGEDDADCDDNARYRKGRADKEVALAGQEKLKLGHLEKELLSASELALVWSQMLGAFSQKLSGLPPKLFSRYPGLTEEGRNFLRDEMQAALDDLSRWAPK